MDSRGHNLSSYRHAKCFLIDGVFCDTPILQKKAIKISTLFATAEFGDEEK